MTDEITIQNVSILVDLQPTKVRGVKDVSLIGDSLDKVAEKSEEAFNKAMDTIKVVAARAFSAVQQIELSERPDEVSVAFGLKLTASGGVLIANAEAESQISVTFSWKNEKMKVSEVEDSTNNG